MKSAAIAANFLFANVILIPSCLAVLFWRGELTFDQLPAMILMIVGTILASSVGRVIYQISLTVTGGDNGFVTMFWNLVPALTALVSLTLSRWIADEHFAINPTFFVGSVVIGAALLLFSLKSWRQPSQARVKGAALGGSRHHELGGRAPAIVRPAGSHIIGSRKDRRTNDIPIVRVKAKPFGGVPLRVGELGPIPRR